MKTSKWYLLLLSMLATLCLAVLAFSQDGKPSYQPTELQHMRLQLKQQQAVIAKQQVEAAQRALQDSQKAFQEALKALTEEGNKVKQEQKWPPTVQLDMDSLTFAEPVKVEPTKKP